ncbi:MAG: DUF2671 domain-containing protein [Rickettsiales bacterium]|nr:DUF2671 domain-containing protein [Pseudomonadota bacterium]MDA0965491.1 DUF2671 domain-containing protein [Pseudomonadota bacterium]MDG4542815.1 DUF2671 domain-containing protein [Rickettsiales bacterium]MDG4544737.1 DUF2671 domain-containing protein [Rickettsiales bacterium]MDG4546859.1 DUF2671 domain-containing protein [Rickettsiales bacterium]
MSSVLNLIKNLPEIASDNNNPATDINYIRKSTNLVNDALSKGSDIMQLANGDILITEVKTVTYKYAWNKEQNKFERVTSGSKVRRRAKLKEAND